MISGKPWITSCSRRTTMRYSTRIWTSSGNLLVATPTAAILKKIKASQTWLKVRKSSLSLSRLSEWSSTGQARRKSNHMASTQTAKVASPCTSIDETRAKISTWSRALMNPFITSWERKRAQIEQRRKTWIWTVRQIVSSIAWWIRQQNSQWPQTYQNLASFSREAGRYHPPTRTARRTTPMLSPLLSLTSSISVRVPLWMTLPMSWTCARAPPRA